MRVGAEVLVVRGAVLVAVVVAVVVAEVVEVAEAVAAAVVVVSSHGLAELASGAGVDDEDDDDDEVRDPGWPAAESGAGVEEALGAEFVPRAASRVLVSGSHSSQRLLHPL